MLFDLGLLTVRVVVGGILVAHGLQKFGYLGGNGLQGTAGFLESGLGFRPGRFWAWVVALAELGGGLLIVLGFLGPIGPMLAVADMLVALITVHWQHGFFNSEGGIEFALIVAAASAAIGLTGFGAWSLDALLGIVVPDWLIVVALIVAVAAVVVTLFMRNTTQDSASS